MNDKRLIRKQIESAVKERFTLKHLAKASLALVLTVAALPSSAMASEVDTANQVLGTEGGKEAMNQALKMARTKPALSVATGIVCLACMPTATAVASPALCVACGILIAKTYG